MQGRCGRGIRTGSGCPGSVPWRGKQPCCCEAAELHPWAAHLHTEGPQGYALLSEPHEAVAQPACTAGCKGAEWRPRRRHGHIAAWRACCCSRYSTQSRCGRGKLLAGRGLDRGGRGARLVGRTSRPPHSSHGSDGSQWRYGFSEPVGKEASSKAARARAAARSANTLFEAHNVSKSLREGCREGDGGASAPGTASAAVLRL